MCHDRRRRISAVDNLLFSIFLLRRQSTESSRLRPAMCGLISRFYEIRQRKYRRTNSLDYSADQVERRSSATQIELFISSRRFISSRIGFNYSCSTCQHCSEAFYAVKHEVAMNGYSENTLIGQPRLFFPASVVKSFFSNGHLQITAQGLH